ncbi:lazarillo protein-like [Periplaneta americana]|uniref:lazarillo protein-like n=1 Tax=Periplaneta americana TaxID=6978 RepID=UPI0037E79D4D
MLVVLLAVVCLVGAAQSCDLKTSKQDDLIPERLVGEWYAFYTFPKNFSNCYSCYNASYTLTSKDQLYVKNIYYDKRNTNPVRLEYNSEVTVKKNVLEWKGKRSEWDANYYVFATDYDNFIVLGGCPQEFSPSPLYWVAFRKQSDYSKEQQDAEDALQTYDLSLQDFAKTC